MRHRKKVNHLSRKSAHRKAMLANMASSLILHKRINTTTAKAKELRTFVEPIITRSKEDSTHSRRMVFKSLRDKFAVSELFREVATKVGERPGGYTRIIKLGNRLGDNADMCIIELVDYNENLLAEKAGEKPKSSRRRRGGKKKETGEEAGVAVVAEVAESDAVETGKVVEAVEAVTETESEPVEVVETYTEPEAKAEDLTTEPDTAEIDEAVVAEVEETTETLPEADEDKEEKKEE